MYSRQNANRVWAEDFRQEDVRRSMLATAVHLCRELSFSEATLSAAVVYIDAILSNCEVDDRREGLMACLAVVFAGKLIESDQKIPSNQRLKSYFGHTYTLSEIEAIEASIFAAFGFNMVVKTTHDFAYFFLSKGVVAVGEVLATRVLGQIAGLDLLEKHVGEFVSALRELYHMNRFLPAVQAALAVGCARNASGFAPWSDGLEEMTGFAWADLRIVFDFLLDQLRLALSPVLLLLKVEKIGPLRNGHLDTALTTKTTRVIPRTPNPKMSGVDKSRTVRTPARLTENKENEDNLLTSPRIRTGTRRYQSRLGSLGPAL
jgi:hypothetical protein